MINFDEILGEKNIANNEKYPQIAFNLKNEMRKGISLQKHFDKYLVDKEKNKPPELFYIKSVTKDFSKLEKNTCARVSLLIKLQA